MARLSERDARAWHFIAVRVGDTIEPRLSPRVLANRGPVTVRPSPIGSALRRARVSARRLACQSDLVLRTDVRSFYPSVTPSVAFRSLVRLDVEPDVARRTAAMLDGWGSEGYAGLPIGPPGSAVIANAVLHDADASLSPFRYLRWVDDYVIGLPSEPFEAEVLDRLDLALQANGLERSTHKTELVLCTRGLVWPGNYGSPPRSQLLPTP